jgi:hypothetical protein
MGNQLSISGFFASSQEAIRMGPAGELQEIRKAADVVQSTSELLLLRLLGEPLVSAVTWPPYGLPVSRSNNTQHCALRDVE